MIIFDILCGNSVYILRVLCRLHAVRNCPVKFLLRLPSLLCINLHNYLLTRLVTDCTGLRRTLVRSYRSIVTVSVRDLITQTVFDFRSFVTICCSSSMLFDNENRSSV